LTDPSRGWWGVVGTAAAAVTLIPVAVACIVWLALNGAPALVVASPAVFLALGLVAATSARLSATRPTVIEIREGTLILRRPVVRRPVYRLARSRVAAIDVSVAQPDVRMRMVADLSVLVRGSDVPVYILRRRSAPEVRWLAYVIRRELELEQAA
jgi:hypothetical protein